MAEYRIVYTETVRHVFYVEAENEESATVAFEKGIESGEFDFSGGGVVDTDYTVKKCFDPTVDEIPDSAML